MIHSFEERSFRIWEFSVHHSRLLIRSAKIDEDDFNVDLIFTAVDYLSLPDHMKGLEIDTASDKEIKSIENLLNKQINKNDITIIVANGKRHFVVSAGFKISKNKLDLLDSGREIP
ncbi:hypothetical protein [Gimesia aquarii]|uniref:Uncharacterized protein n=1 Tax=Gimesia aquarii TaxID=2527964 RepID=A0A517WUV7_9PLAN|nr:hypothetical protein [Gimesia aquarii]QDU09047.1 hypothetical protein V202x_24180 [Gimesia aquarii]